ncbi:MAG: UDP-3-O-(3-hydroxymyristoyl)glucosamine N-acyltransferase [Planctomycetota bacterium]
MASLRFSLATIANRVGGELRGEESAEVSGLGTLDTAGPNQVTFARSNEFADSAKASKAGAILVSEFMDIERPQIRVSDPDLAFAKTAQLFHPRPRATTHEVHASAIIDESANLESPVRIGAGVVIGAGVKIGAGSVVGPGCVIEDGVVLGQNCVLVANVTLCHDIQLGDRVILHPGSVIGADGFGFAPDNGTWAFIPQIGTVQLQDDVEIGANSTVDRATMGATTVERGTKIDNMVHVGHNSTIGEHSIIAGFSAIAGSVKVGHHCMFAGHVAVASHLSIPPETQLGGASVVLRTIRKSGRYMGHPLQPLQDSIRWMRRVIDIEDLDSRVKGLERE